MTRTTAPTARERDLQARNARLQAMIADLATSGERTNKALRALLAYIRECENDAGEYLLQSARCIECTCGTAVGPVWRCARHEAERLT